MVSQANRRPHDALHNNEMTYSIETMVFVVGTAFLAVCFQAGTTLSTNADTVLLSVVFSVLVGIQD